MYSLSEKAISEKYEDLLFTKVMALYAAEESEKILSEIENEEPADPKNIEKIYSKTERRENLSVLWKVSKKLITVAAMVVFVAVVSLSSVVVASAEAREAVAEAIYHLVLEEHEEYTRVSIGESTDFVDPEIYDWEGAYAPTYIPEGFTLYNVYKKTNPKIVDYICGDKYITFYQSPNAVSHADTENADTVEYIQIGDSEALFVVKDNLTTIVWRYGDILLGILGNISSEEVLKVAESIKPIGYLKTEEPEGEYTFIDPELYDWEGAYAPTYIPEGFVLLQKQRFGSQYCVDYKREGGYISFLQAGKDVIFQVDTEGADTVEKILIGESEGLLVSEDGNTYLNWSIGNTNFQIYGTCEIEEIIKMAKGIKPLGKTETEEPAEEYEFIDPEIYDWEGAYAPTYMASGYVFSELKESPGTKLSVYNNNDKYVSFSQSYDGVFQVDTEDADVVKEIIINDNDAIYVEKNGFVIIIWNIEKNTFSIRGTIEPDEAIKIAEGIKPIN